MNNPGRACLKLLKRHAEALFIIAFILADCFLSGWALTAGTVAAILYVGLPALRAMWSLDPKGRITYLKAFVKTPAVQRLAILLFWIYSIRLLIGAACEAQLFGPEAVTGGTVPSISTALFQGAREFAPVALLACPIIIYAGACGTAIFLRSRLKATRQDPDLIKQRQHWSGATHFLFMCAYIGSILIITLNTKGPAYMLSNWFLASARDANIFGDWVQPGMQQPPPPVVSHQQWDQFAPILQSVDGGNIFSNYSFIEPFDAFIITSVSLVLFFVFLQLVLRLNAFLTSFCWRAVSFKSLQNIIEGFLEALRLPSRTLNFREAHPVLNNAWRTLVWLVLCYAGLFWLFGFCPGPLGYAIHNWMAASTVDAGFGDSMSPPAWLFDPKFKIFLASIVALYGTAPIAVTACVFLPFAKPRKIVLNSDGISFAQGPYLSLWGRQFRLWSDLKSMTAKTIDRPNRKLVARFTLSFRSGGRITFDNSQISPKDLKVLLEGIDQHAVACTVDAEVFRVCQALDEADTITAVSDGIDDTAIVSIPAQEFKSTIFVPFGPGEFVPNTNTRIIKQLVSKPLCAVYLAREQDGRMVTVKQFYLADENDETRALKKMLNREYDLLSRLDHPGIAKVVDSFTVHQSTYLVIEHRVGGDLREVVQEHGARSEALTIAWAKQICEIMIYLHSREPSIVHRDLTPDNVIAGEDGQLRLIDFGAAREFLEGITGTMIGKHCYVSPEQLRGDANQKSDIYSFGGLLYFLLTGRDPVSLAQSSPASNVACSDELDQLIRDCTEFDEDKRPQSFQEVLQRLQNMGKAVKVKVPAAKAKVPV